MKIKFNKIHIIIGIVVLLIGLVCFLMNYYFYSSTPVNKYIVSNFYKTPSNIEFTDGNFYQSVVDEHIIELTDNCITYNATADILYTDNYNEDILKYFKIGDTFDEVKSLFSTNGNISFLDKDNNNKLGTDVTKTGDRFKIVTDHEHVIYLALKGDVNGTGKINIEDVDKAYKILRGEVDVKRYYEVAGDVDNDGNLKINDVAKLYSYVNKKINSLGKISKEDKIHFIAVGGSDAFLIESNGFYGLVDSSNPNDNSAQAISDYNKNVSKVIDYLKKIGVETLDFILATHSHSDHIGGMPMIANAGFVDRDTKYYYRTYLGTDEDIIVPDWDNRGYYEKAVNAMKSKGVQMIEVTNKEPTIKLGDFSIKLVNTDGVANESQENFNAIGALVTKGNTKIFLAADIEIVDAGKVADIVGDVDVLKLNHHGHSGYDGNYLTKLNPENIIVTNNKFEDLFKLYASDLINRGIKVYMTGTSVDAIRLTVDDNGYSIEKNINPLSYKMQGWQRIYNNHVYYNSDGVMARGWHQLGWSEGVDWFYFDDNGVMLTGFQELIWGDNKEFKNWFYFDETNGNMLTGWQYIGISWYYFNPQGIMLTGWIEVNGNLYYLNKDGVMLTDWQQIDGDWYYFGTDGKRVYGWQQLGWSGGTSWFYFNETDGYMMVDWQYIDDSWYYLDPVDGFMVTGWRELTYKGVKSWYYFEESGKMVSDICKVINGTNYCFDGSGVCTSDGC